VFRKVFEQEARDAGQTAWDRDALRLILANPTALGDWGSKLRPADLIDSSPSVSDAQPLLAKALEMKAAGETVSGPTVLAALDAAGQTPQQLEQRREFLAGEPTEQDGEALVGRISDRSRLINGRLTRWAGYTSMMLNIGAFFGIYGFSLLTHRIGRRPAFAVAFTAAGLSTALVFWKLNDTSDVFWMIPLMGFCLLSLFGGYAIYFPELFPTRLRSTGTSFCYNVGRFVAASGPFTLGLLTSEVFAAYPEPMRYAGITMCSVFLLGLLALPFAPETRDQPLPD
jgi:MFS family permease